MKQISKDVEMLYHTEGAPLLRYIRRCGGGSCSEDLLQDTFVHLLAKPDGLRNANSPRAWIYGVARRVVLGFLRRQSRFTELVTEPSSPPVSEVDGRLWAVRAAMAKLPKLQREVLQLRLDAELSYEEIASTLAIPVGTVRSRLHHAVRQLRSALGREGE
jgi:RNA polymerase sigma-70 factor (ECF subfamily)